MKEILYRLDERTDMISKQMEVQNERIVEQRQHISDVENMSQDNRLILSGMTFGLSTLVVAAVGKMMGLISL